MYLNSYMLAELMDGIESTNLHSNPMKAELTCFAVLDAEMKLFQNCVYVAKAEELLKLPTQQHPYTIISIGAAPQLLWDDPNCDLLCCRPSLSIYSALSMVHDVFKRYSDWEQCLFQTFAENKSLDELCRLSLPIFRTPIVVINEKREVIGSGADTDKYSLPEVVDIGPSSYETYKNKTPQIYTTKDGGIALYINIFIDEKFMARILLINTLRDTNESDLAPIVTLAKYIETYLRNFKMFRNSNQESFKNLLNSFILTDSANSNSRHKIETHLTKIDWRSSDPYVCATIRSYNYDHSHKWTQYVGNTIEANIKGCLTLNQKDNLFLICNLRISDCSVEELLTTLTDLSKTHAFILGVSSEYNDFLETPAFHKQSAAALETGVKVCTDRNVFYFPDIILAHIVLNGFNSLPPIAMIPKPLKVLMDYDVTENSELCHTLDICYKNYYMYLEKTSEDLHIHRSTLKYRLERIQQISPEIDIKDPRTRLLLQCIFEAIKAGTIADFTLAGWKD